MSNLFEATYNPDVLSCLANLSNDEVFTPPEVANQMLDLLPSDIWSDPTIKILDPACKSGVFLREAAKRFIVGLEDEYPDLEERLEHIFKEQLYGIAITELTSLLSRRSLYCSKYPNYKYSIVQFDDAEGNIRFRHCNHSWYAGRCKVCGASQKEYERDKSLEQYAYEFIHLEDPEKVLMMKFDVIISNPPYQMSDGGGNGSSAIPIYHEFIEQAKKLNPRYLSMIVPSRWFAGGRGLDKFRDAMLHDRRIRTIVDYPNASECFPGVEIKGGVCYFLWDRDNEGPCKVVTNSNSVISFAERELLEEGCSTFIRYNDAINILHKVQQKKEARFSSLVSANDPFGYDLREKNSYRRIKPDIKNEPFNNSVKIYYYGWLREGIGYVSRESVRRNTNLISSHKILISKAYGAGETFPHQILGVPFIAEENSVCTETYIFIGPFNSIKETENVLKYISTKFFRFLVMLKKNTQMAMQAVYEFVPIQDFSRPWTDEMLYEKYGINEDEIAFIDSMIRPMDLSGDKDA